VTRFIIIMALTLVFLTAAGCDKEKIVISIEYVHDIEYVELPGDTLLQIDTVFVGDSVIINATDTVVIRDTVVQTTTIHDTTVLYDTVVTQTHHYDTTYMVDTVQVTQCSPNEYLAFAALQYYSDPLVIDFINQEFGLNDGWVLYLSAFQVDLTEASTGVYDIYGYIDYWTPDWSAYYPIEFYWRISYSGGDPGDPSNWVLEEPAAASSGAQPGLTLAPIEERTSALRR